MKIARVDVFVLGFRSSRCSCWPAASPVTCNVLSHRVLVKLTTESGAIGWGEATPTPRWTYETTETIVSTLRRYLAPALIGIPCGTSTRCTTRWNARSRPA
jgi:muconate cycloisomerase